MKNVRLIKAIPQKRLSLIDGDATKPPIVGDLGVTDHCFTGPWGREMVLVYFHSADGETEWEAEAYWNELEPSIATDVDIEALFDATALNRSGECPWTIFAYPTDVAWPNGLPPDHDAQMILAELQKRGIPMAIWVNEIEETTTYFACRYEDRVRVDQTITDLENQGILESDFLADRSSQLFARSGTGT